MTVIELLVNRIWYRSRARIWRIRSKDAPPCADTVPLSPIMMLPQEITETIITHFIYDLPTLLSCSLTCYAWYIVAVPHLHPTLLAWTAATCSRKYQWPNPIRSMHMLDLLPFVKTVIIRSSYKRFSPKLFNWFTLRKFSGLTNVRTLKMDHLDIPGFMPGIQRYFGSFLPTVRYLYLKSPKGSNRQIIFFIGLFQDLQDLSLGCRQFYEKNPEEDPTLVPHFIPPLRGQLSVWNCKGGGFFQDMVHLFEGIRFESMSLRNVGETRPLLYACATTLQDLRLHLSDPLGERSCPDYVQSSNLTGFIAMTSLQDFDLSRNKSLRTLILPSCFIDDALHISRDRASMLLKYALSTIRSAAFFRVDVIYGGHSGGFCAITTLSHSSNLYQMQFELLREVHKVRNFQLLLYMMVQGHKEKSAMPELKEAVAAEKARGGFNYLFPEPLVTFVPINISSTCW